MALWRYRNGEKDRMVEGRVGQDISSELFKPLCGKLDKMMENISCHICFAKWSSKYLTVCLSLLASYLFMVYLPSLSISLAVYIRTVASSLVNNELEGAEVT